MSGTVEEGEWQTTKKKPVSRKYRQKPPSSSTSSTSTSSSTPPTTSTSTSAHSPPPTQKTKNDVGVACCELGTDEIPQSEVSKVLESIDACIEFMNASSISTSLKAQILDTYHTTTTDDNNKNVVLVAYGIGPFSRSCLYKSRTPPNNNRKTKKAATPTVYEPVLSSMMNEKLDGFIGTGWSAGVYQLCLYLIVMRFFDDFDTDGDNDDDGDDNDIVRTKPNVLCYFYDPISTPLEKSILANLGVTFLSFNDRGAWDILKSPSLASSSSFITTDVNVDIESLNISPPTSTSTLVLPYTLMYMPHCPLGLYSSLLLTNYKEPSSLNSLHVIGNSFTAYIDNQSSRNEFEEGVGVFMLDNLKLKGADVMREKAFDCGENGEERDGMQKAFSSTKFVSFDVAGDDVMVVRGFYKEQVGRIEAKKSKDGDGGCGVSEVI